MLLVASSLDSHSLLLTVSIGCRVTTKPLSYRTDASSICDEQRHARLWRTMFLHKLPFSNLFLHRLDREILDANKLWVLLQQELNSTRQLQHTFTVAYIVIPFKNLNLPYASHMQQSANLWYDFDVLQVHFVIRSLILEVVVDADLVPFFAHDPSNITRNAVLISHHTLLQWSHLTHPLRMILISSSGCISVAPFTRFFTGSQRSPAW